ncbi:hypothetical protein Zm00014a_008419 [Zea mays]|uniref:Transposase Tnp1/En/Spm-like domain-containing protein n=1 Tax=Zea mays TaxID=4577 RepID=A0A3L6DZQ9_MAIZE|nr:hypothetical protein Zm00014a_008419 [Zea mays]
MEPNSKNPTNMDADIKVEDEETNVEVKRRGKTKLLQVWNIPRGHRIVVQCNELDQPIGEEAEIMGKFLGMVARNGNLCSLSYKDWRLLIGKKERLTNEQKNKEDILKQVKGLEANYNNVPPGVIADQWIALVNHWVTTKAKGCLDDLPANQFPTSSKRKRVYVEPQNQEFRMDNEKTYSKREQEAKEYEDLQPTFRKTSTIHKTRQFELERDITFDNTKLANSSKSMTKEATSTSLNEEASKKQVKRKDMQSATTFDKTKCATTSKGTPGDRPTDESILDKSHVAGKNRKDLLSMAKLQGEIRKGFFRVL